MSYRRCSRIYTESGSRSSRASRTLMHVGQFIDSHRTVLLSCVVACGRSFVNALLPPGTRATLIVGQVAAPIGVRLPLYNCPRLSHVGHALRGWYRSSTLSIWLSDSCHSRACRAISPPKARYHRGGQSISSSFARYDERQTWRTLCSLRGNGLAHGRDMDHVARPFMMKNSFPMDRRLQDYLNRC